MKSHLVGRGCVGTGEFQNAWAEDLREAVLTHHTPIVVPDPGTEHGRALVAALGAEFVFNGYPESELRKRATSARARLRAQGIKDCTPGRDR